MFFKKKAYNIQTLIHSWLYAIPSELNPTCYDLRYSINSRRTCVYGHESCCSPTKPVNLIALTMLTRSPIGEGNCSSLTLMSANLLKNLKTWRRYSQNNCVFLCVIDLPVKFLLLVSYDLVKRHCRAITAFNRHDTCWAQLGSCGAEPWALPILQFQRRD